MSGCRFSFPACVIAGKRRLDVDDLLMLRKHAFSDGIRREDDVRLLLAIHRSCASACPEWNSYIVESLAGYAVHGLHPRGWMDDANADWLIDLVSVGGVVHCPVELEVVLHTLDIAASVPDRLYAFALEQLRLGLQPAARNAYARARPSRSQGMDLPDLHYLWRVLRGATERGKLALSHKEREVLQAIDAIADPAEHHDGWNRLVAPLLNRLAPTGSARRRRWLDVADETLIGEDACAA